LGETGWFAPSNIPMEPSGSGPMMVERSAESLLIIESVNFMVIVIMVLVYKGDR
jgi:hypothetical protein